MIVHLLAVMSPGPDFTVVLKQSFSNGRLSAIFTSLGIAVGILLHVLFCIFGIAYIITTTPLLFKIFKFIGVMYLFYIGFKSFFNSSYNNTIYDNMIVNREAYYKSFLLGFITNVFNPKATMFFLSLFTLIIDASTPIIIKISYGAWMSIITGAWFCLVSILFTSSFSKIFIRKYSTLIDKIMGIILMFISIRILLN